MLYQIKGNQYQVDLHVEDNRIEVCQGYFGDMKLVASDLISGVLRDLSSQKEIDINKHTKWHEIRVNQYANYLEVFLMSPDDIEHITIILKANYNHNSIEWKTTVCNDNELYSVMEISYPTPIVSHEYFYVFKPENSGLVIRDAGKKEYCDTANYPCGRCHMQYFAAYSDINGIYIGIEDEHGYSKDLTVKLGNNCASFKSMFCGVNATCAANSFTLSGIAKWQFFKGDWYDATMIYSKFIQNKSNWLPQMGENGRVDTEQRYKEIPFWVADYIPNSELQGSNRPMWLSAKSDIYDKDYWIDAVIELQKELNVPIAYHVYNWHEIPFNIEYPHFKAAKKVFVEGLKKLKEHNIAVFPYINAASWESMDALTGHEVNFENTGIHGVVLDEKGNVLTAEYPQETILGEKSQLAVMCPESHEWHKIIADVAQWIETELDVDGIYFDEIAAKEASHCYNPAHKHTRGGGNYWIQGYKMMMDHINANKPKGHYYFTENNAEPYVNNFDGFLTWTWLKEGQVPAFPAVYAGYVQMIGRSTVGLKKDDVDFFKYSIAQSLLYGQQIGWVKADVIYNKEQLSFLKTIVRLRNEYNALFSNGTLLRPPKVVTTVPNIITTPALWYEEDIHMEQVLAGTWKYRLKETSVIFLINLSKQEADFEVTIPYREYGFEQSDLPETFEVYEDVAVAKGIVAAEGYLVWKLSKKITTNVKMEERK